MANISVPPMRSKTMIHFVLDEAHAFKDFTREKANILVKVDEYILDSGEFGAENAEAISKQINPDAPCILSEDQAQDVIACVLKDFMLVVLCS